MSIGIDSPAALRERSFRKELRGLLNCHSRDNDANTPDYVLEQFVASCLDAFTIAVQQRDTHEGRDARPSPPRVVGLDSAAALAIPVERSFGSLLVDVRFALLEKASKALNGGSCELACQLLEAYAQVK